MARGLDRPPLWAVVTIVAGLALLAVGTPIALSRGQVTGATESTPSAATTTAPASAPTVAFLGDSYTVGAGASAPERRWATLVAAARGWHELNFGQNGTGYVNSGATSDDAPY